MDVSVHVDLAESAESQQGPPHQPGDHTDDLALIHRAAIERLESGAARRRGRRVSAAQDQVPDYEQPDLLAAIDQRTEVIHLDGVAEPTAAEETMVMPSIREPADC